MNEIEKLYENAGFEREFEKPVECIKNLYISCEGCMLYDNKKGKCNNRKEYPPFTAEKQLELIKWLCTEDDDFFSIIAIDYGCWKINYHREDCISEDIKGRSDLNFENALANLINNLWQSLTEEERKQIKEILK